MTATLTQVRRAVATQLAAQIDGLSTYPTDPGSIEAPAAVVAPAPGVFLDYDPAPDAADLDLVIGVFVQHGDNDSAYDDLDAYLADDGDKSIRQALYADVTLGGVVDSVRLLPAQNYGKYTFGRLEYLGVEFPIEVLL